MSSLSTSELEKVENLKEKVEKKRVEFNGLIYHFLFMLILFFLSVFFGYYQALTHTSLANKEVNALFNEFSFIKKEPIWAIFLIIFLNNSIKAIVSTIAGIFAGIFPASFVFINGYLVGVVVYIKGQQIGYFKTIMYLLPHGIIEIPAFLLACSYGSWLGLRFLRKIFGKEDVNLKEDAVAALKACFRIVVPMLLLAAFVETFITPLVVRLV